MYKWIYDQQQIYVHIPPDDCLEPNAWTFFLFRSIRFLSFGVETTHGHGSAGGKQMQHWTRGYWEGIFCWERGRSARYTDMIVRRNCVRRRPNHYFFLYYPTLLCLETPKPFMSLCCFLCFGELFAKVRPACLWRPFPPSPVYFLVFLSSPYLKTFNPFDSLMTLIFMCWKPS